MTSRSKMISVVLPTHNGARFLRQSLASCLQQTYSNIELVVVVDGSTDETMPILDQISDPRLTIIVNETNLGLPESLNKGFAHSKGDYLTWTSDDNFYAPNALAVMAQYLDEHAEVGMVYCDYWKVDGDGNVLEICPTCEPAEILTTPINRIGPCFAYRREVFDIVGKYDSAWSHVEDYDYWLRIARDFKLLPLHEPMYYYRHHGESLTATYSRYKIQRLALKLAFRRGILSRSAYLRWLGDSHVDEAFYLHGQNERQGFVQSLFVGVLQSPRHLRNRGVWSIILDAILGHSFAYRLKRSIGR